MLAAIVFGLFSLVTYAIIIKELENSVDTRIMIEAPDAHRDGLRTRVEREGRIARPIVEEEVGDPREVFAYNVTWIRNGVNETLIKSENWPAGLATEVASYGEGKTIQPTDVLNIIRGKRRSRSSDSSERGRGGPRPPLLEGERRDGGGTNGEERRPPPRGESSERRGGGTGRGRWLRLRVVEEPTFHYRTAEGMRWRVGVFKGEVTEMVVAASIDGLNSNVQKLRASFAIAIPSAIALIALGAWFVSGQAIRPIRRITDKAETLTAAGLSERLPEPGTGDELQRLSIVLNNMLNRLESSFHQATRFSADASHELKTPLTIMQGEMEAALRGSAPGSVEQEVFASQLEETSRLKEIIASLLLLSRADAGQLRLTRERIDMSQNFAEVCEDAEILAALANIELSTDIHPDLHIMGDRSLFQQVLQNLVANAVKYNCPEGSIACRLIAEEANAILEIENTGTGIPEEDREKVFRRFHRADAARSRDVDGFGLGLNLALEIARAHDGELQLIHSDEKSTLFRLTIPLAPKA